jgi:hypothetical protein
MAVNFSSASWAFLRWFIPIVCAVSQESYTYVQSTHIFIIKG